MGRQVIGFGSRGAYIFFQQRGGGGAGGYPGFRTACSRSLRPSRFVLIDALYRQSLKVP